MKRNIDLSIVIVSFNTKRLMDNCIASILKSLQDSSMTHEVIVIDNNSSDGTLKLLAKHYPAIRIIKNRTNVGFGKANNQGANAAQGEVVLFLNSDCVVLDQAIEKLYSFFTTLPQKSIVGGKLFNPDHTPQSSCGTAYTLPVIVTALFLRGDYMHITRYSPHRVKEVDWVMGACIMLRKSAFHEIEGFDEHIFMYMEEIDFLHRAKKTGYKIYFYPEAHFVHLGGASSMGEKTPVLNLFKGLIYYYKKHYSQTSLFILRLLLFMKASIALIVFTLLQKSHQRYIYFQAIKVALT